MERVGVMADVQQGTVVTVASDVMINGVPAFAGGEQVTVQQVAPNAQRPEYKYTVYSTRLSQWYQLRDEDIVSATPAYTPPPIPQQQAPGAAPQYQQPAAAPRAGGGGVDFSMMEAYDWLVGAGGIVMVIASFIWFFGYGVLWPLLGIAAIVLVILDKLAKVPAIADLPYLSWIYMGIGGLAMLLALLRIIQTLSYRVTLLSWWVVLILELAAGAAVLVGGIMRQREGF
jgi:hypothetical protein